MVKGGYQIIDFKNFNFNVNNYVHIDGIFNLIANTKKPTIISGFIFNNINFKNLWANFVTNNNQVYTAIEIVGFDPEDIGLAIISIQSNDRVDVKLIPFE